LYGFVLLDDDPPITLALTDRVVPIASSRGLDLYFAWRHVDPVSAFFVGLHCVPIPLGGRKADPGAGNRFASLDVSDRTGDALRQAEEKVAGLHGIVAHADDNPFTPFAGGPLDDAQRVHPGLHQRKPVFAVAVGAGSGLLAVLVRPQLDSRPFCTVAVRLFSNVTGNRWCRHGGMPSIPFNNWPRLVRTTYQTHTEQQAQHQSA